MFYRYFKQCYLNSLVGDYRFYYDDISEYGNPYMAKHVFYFIPGINGVPGQIRFAFPALSRRYGRDFYVKCLYVPEFSAAKPVWEKYTPENTIKRKEQIITDITQLMADHGKINLLISSNGFYDFIHAVPELSALLPQITLYWVAAAPDGFMPNIWLDRFYRLNGFMHNHYRWAAFPNHNGLTWLNPETSSSHQWEHNHQRRVFFKADLESRFRCRGILWSYASIDAFNACLQQALSEFNVASPLTLTSYVLVASKDGYWQGKTPEGIEGSICKYLLKPRILFTPDSHLWVVKPNNLSRLLEMDD